jgi:3-oxoadipate CoA-transferase beta subunit
VFVTTDHVTKKGEPKIVEQCSYPLTGMACVDRIYTDLAVIDVTSVGLVVTEMVPGITEEQLQALTGAPLLFNLNRTATGVSQ